MKLQLSKDRDNAWYEALWNFALSRSIMLLVTFLAASRFPTATRSLSQFIPAYNCAHLVKRCLQTWNQWDTIHYVAIAQYGYQYSAHQAGYPQNTAFFPLWPLLIRIVAWPLGNRTGVYYLTGIALSNLLFYFALVVLYCLIRDDFDTSIAKKTLFFLAISPYSLFFSVGYTESLFLLLTLGTFVFIRRDQWLLAGVCGLLATLTRQTGIVLLVPCLVLAIQRIGWQRLFTFKQIRLKASMIGALLLIPGGLLLYMLYLKFTFGDPLYFIRWEHQEWLRTTTWPWVAIVQSVQALFNHMDPFDVSFNNLIFVALPLIALAIGWRRLPLHYGLFVLALAILALSNPTIDPINTLASAPRYIFVAFPLFVIFAHWVRRPRVEMFLTMLFLAYLTYNIISFVTNNWVA